MTGGGGKAKGKERRGRDGFFPSLRDGRISSAMAGTQASSRCGQTCFQPVVSGHGGQDARWTAQAGSLWNR